MNRTTNLVLIGIAFSLMLMIPQALWMKRQAAQPMYAEFVKKHSFLLVLESSPKYLTMVSAIFLTGQADAGSQRSPWLLAGAVGLMIFYNACWMRRFAQKLSVIGVYDMIQGLPPVQAMLPIAAFILLGVYENSFSIIFFCVLWAIGHIVLVLKHYREISDLPASKI